MRFINYYLALTTFLITMSVTAQEKVYFPTQKQTTDFYKVEISNIVGRSNEVKFKLEIENTTSDYLLFDASKCMFEINGSKITPNDKFLVIEPYKKKSKTISALGSGLNVHSFNFKLDGLQRIVYLDEIIKVDQFNLPPNTNDFVANKFEVSLKSFKKETNASSSKFDVQYKGEKIGFVFPSKITVSMPDGNEYANAKKADPILLFPGEKSSFNANWGRMPGGSINDMQKVQMKINFTDVFREGKAVNIPEQQFSFVWDEALTIEKNK